MGKVWILLIGLVFSSFFSWAQAPLSAPEGSLAFPKDQAGVGAWVKLDRTITIDEKLSSIFYRIEDVSGSHIIGTIEVSDFVHKEYPHLYIDVNGWLIAFFPSKEPAARMVLWSGTAYDPLPRISTTLEAALEKACAALQYPLPQVTFCDFRYPQANNLVVLLRIFPAADTKVMYVKFPTAYKIFNISYFYYGCNFDCRAYWQSYVATLRISLPAKTLKVWESRLQGDEDRPLTYEVKDLPLDVLRVGELYQIELEFKQENGDCGSAGVALVVVYQAP